MSRLSTSGFAGRQKSKREPIEVPEPKRPDKSIDMLISVRKNRVSRFERERAQAREEWREARVRLRQAKQQWRDALAAAHEGWKQAREEFFRMSTTSGQFRKARAVYERMKQAAGQMQLEAREVAQHCRELGAKFFDATQQLAQMRRQQEKLSILRDELRAMNTQGGD